MGEARKDALHVDFDRSVKLEFHGSTVSSDGGLLAYRELDEAFGLTAMADHALRDLRTGGNVRHSMRALLRQSLYSRLAGYDDLNDAERLAVDPVMRQVVGGRAVDRAAASTSQMARFETEVLTQPQNLTALMALPGQWVDHVRQAKPIKKLILDLDSSVSETYGQQEGSAYNGHFGCECYHPLFCFNQDGDVERAQPWELPAATGAAGKCTTLDADDVAGEAYQDRGEGRASRAVRDLPDGGGGRVAKGLRCDPRPDIPVGRQGAGRADCGVRVRGEAPFQRCTNRSRGAIGTGIAKGKQRLKVNLGYPEAIGTLTEAMPTPENRQIGLCGGAVRRYHGAVRPGTVPGHGPNGKSRSNQRLQGDAEDRAREPRRSAMRGKSPCPIPHY